MSPESHPFFSHFEVEHLTTADFDRAIAASENELVAIFFWGHNCPNCDVAKNAMVQHTDQVKSLNLKWYSVNVYENAELGTKFGLHGVPTFFFFYRGKRLGRISPFPGMAPFVEALKKLKQDIDSAASSERKEL